MRLPTRSWVRLPVLTHSPFWCVTPGVGPFTHEVVGSTPGSDTFPLLVCDTRCRENEVVGSTLGSDTFPFLVC